MFSCKRDRYYVTTQTGASMLTMEKQINKVVAAEDPLVTSDLHQGIGEVNLGREYFFEPPMFDLQELWEYSSHNPDPDKRKLYDALFIYVLDKRQRDVISEHYFTI